MKLCMVPIHKNKTGGLYEEVKKTAALLLAASMALAITAYWRRHGRDCATGPAASSESKAEVRKAKARRKRAEERNRLSHNR